MSATGTSTLSNALMEFEYYGGAWMINGVSQPSQTALLAAGVSTIVLNAPIVNGAVDLQYALNASATANGAGNSSATVDFLDPVSITGASALDANGNAVSASFVSESGFNPNAAGVVPTPEPSTLMLLGSGALGLVGPICRKLLG